MHRFVGDVSRTAAATSTLPGQSPHLGNVSLWYEKAGFSAKTSWNFHGKYIDAVGESAADDVYYDNHTQLDLVVSQRLARQVRVYADFLNLTNAPLRYYEGVHESADPGGVLPLVGELWREGEFLACERSWSP